MKTVLLLALGLVATNLIAGEASETDLRRRNQLRREVAELEARRNALKGKIRTQLEAAETLTVTAELMEGARKLPPVARERLSELHSYEVDVPRTQTKTAAEKAQCVHRWLTLEETRRYRFTAEVKAEDVRETHVKFGLMVPQPSGKTLWPAASVGAGTFDWRLVTFDFEVPAGAGNALLLYGLESGSGKVSFRNVTVYEISRVLD